MIFCGAILTLLESPSKTFLTLIAAFTALPTVISLLLLFLMGRVTRHLLKIQLLVTYQPVLLQLSEVLSCTIRWNNMRNKQWGVSATAFLNNIFLCILHFVLVGLYLLNWRVDYSDVYLSFLCLMLAPVTFAMNRYLVDE